MIETPGARALRQEFEQEQERAHKAMRWGFYLRRGLSINELQKTYSVELQNQIRKIKREARWKTS